MLEAVRKRRKDITVGLLLIYLAVVWGYFLLSPEHAKEDWYLKSNMAAVWSIPGLLCLAGFNLFFYGRLGQRYRVILAASVAYIGVVLFFYLVASAYASSPDVATYAAVVAVIGLMLIAGFSFLLVPKE